jgi:hypothetical protein
MPVFDPNNPNDKVALAAFSSNHFYADTRNPLLKEDNTMTSKLKNIATLALIIFCLGAVLFLTIRAVSVLSNPTSNGIITIPSWGEGVLLCGDKHNKVTEGDNHYWNDVYGAWTVNAGHMDDIELDELKYVATFTCPYNTKGIRGIATHDHFFTNDGKEIKFHAVQIVEEGVDISNGGLKTADAELEQHMRYVCDHDFNAILRK